MSSSTDPKQSQGDLEQPHEGSPSPPLIACVVGATGLVGQQLTRQLLSDDDYDEVRIFVRRSTGQRHEKLSEFVVDFESPETFKKELIGEVLFSCLGTTVKNAGGQKRQYRIDHDLNLRLAELACDSGVPAYVLLSAAGASPKSRIFYLRMKGELERDVSVLPFESLRVLRPGLLDGKRREDRPGEKLGLQLARLLPHWSSLAPCRPVPVETVARAMRTAAADWSPGVHVIDPAELFALGSD